MCLQVWDGKEAITSAFQRASITTYVRDKLEVRSNCSRWDVSCPLPLWSPVAESKFYVAGVETHDLVIEHAAESKLVPGMNGRGSGLRGNIKCANGTVQPFTRRVELHELLSCAGVHSLDDDSDDPRGLREKKQKEVRRHKDTQQGKPAKSKRRSFRARGLVLHLSIEYTNLADTWVLPGEPTYTITVRHMPQLSYVNTVVLSRSGVYDDLSVRGVNSMFPNMTEEEAAACNGSETRVIRKSSAVHGARAGRAHGALYRRLLRYCSCNGCYTRLHSLAGGGLHLVRAVVCGAPYGGPAACGGTVACGQYVAWCEEAADWPRAAGAAA